MGSLPSPARGGRVIAAPDIMRHLYNLLDSINEPNAEAAFQNITRQMGRAGNPAHDWVNTRYLAMLEASQSEDDEIAAYRRRMAYYRFAQEVLRMLHDKFVFEEIQERVALAKRLRYQMPAYFDDTEKSAHVVKRTINSAQLNYPLGADERITQEELNLIARVADQFNLKIEAINRPGPDDAIAIKHWDGKLIEQLPVSFANDSIVLPASPMAD